MKSIKKQLALASCALISQQSNASEAIENDWFVDYSLLNYSEARERISVNKMLLNVGGNVTNDDKVKLGVVLDTMTGATPTGAVNARGSAVTFTSASGAAGSTNTGESLALAPFDDTRLAVSFDWEHKHNRRTTASYNGSISVENDYSSYGLGATFKIDSKNKLRTYTAGASYTEDLVFQLGGGTPDPLTSVNEKSFLGDGKRISYDFIGGISQVFNKRTVGQINLSLSYSTGYHTDPYKVISMVDDIGIEVERFYEKRPDSRTRWSVYNKVAHQLKNSHDLHLSYRLYSDDWGITSHTVDFKYRIKFKRENYLEPHFRWYNQSAADFFFHSIDFSEDIPLLMSADSRLDGMTGMTFGVKYGQEVGVNGKFRMRLEYINQKFDDAEFDINEATIFQMSYTKQF